MKSQSPTNPSPRAKSVVIGTAGHIDHGKTALVYALTGTNTDRLPEEKQRGITIDLGFASLTLNDEAGRSLRLSLIDVPGHHAFIRNMLAGTGGIDCVMLVVAADEGVKAQTAEHLAICSLLGIQRGLVVLTKSDAVSEEHLRTTRENVAHFLKETFLEGSPILSVSAFTGVGMDELKKALAALALEIAPRSNEAVLRLPLDRSFSVRGFGTVVTGTLQAGTIKVGDTLEQSPAGRSLRVRGIQVHNRNCESAEAPCRVALNLSGVEVAQVVRGDTLTTADTLSPSRTLDVDLSMLQDAPAIRHGSRVRVHAFTSESLARVLFFDQKDSREPGSGIARLQLVKPMLLVPGDRVVLRQCSPALTIGGGRVLDVAPIPGVRKAMAFEFLKSLRSGTPAQHLLLRVARRGVEGISINSLVRETGLTLDTLRKQAAELIQGGQIIECAARGAAESHWITPEALQKATLSVEQEIQRAQSLSRAELRTKTKLSQPVLAAALHNKVRSGSFEVAGDVVRVAGSGNSIPEPMRNRLQSIESLYVRAGLAAPIFSEVSKQLGIAPVALRELVTVLIRAKRLVRMGADDALVHPTALDVLYSKMRACRGERFDVGRFKDFTGLTRKHAIPLLEHLDHVRVTRNDGGTRVVL